MVSARSKAGPAVLGRGIKRGRSLTGQPAFETMRFVRQLSPEKADLPSPLITNHYIKEYPMAVFTEDFTRMRQDFDQAQADRDQLIKNTHEWVEEKVCSVQQLMQDMHDRTAEIAAQLRTELQELSTDLRTGGDIFRKDSNPKMAHKASNHRMSCKASGCNGSHPSKSKTAHKAKAKKGR
jgi:hypothetical protein